MSRHCRKQSLIDRCPSLGQNSRICRPHSRMKGSGGRVLEGGYYWTQPVDKLAWNVAVDRINNTQEKHFWSHTLIFAAQDGTWWPPIHTYNLFFTFSVSKTLLLSTLLCFKYDIMCLLLFQVMDFFNNVLVPCYLNIYFFLFIVSHLLHMDMQLCYNK